MTGLAMPLPGKSFQIAGALALAGIVAAVLSGLREPTPAPASPVKAGFEQLDAPDDFPLLKKNDRLPVADPGPVPVKTETIAVVTPPDDEPVAVKAEPKPKRTVEREHERESNICTRHGMHKVETHGGRSWRCRR